MTISGIKSNARQALKGNFRVAASKAFLVMVITFLNLFVLAGPLALGSADFYLSLFRGDKKTFEKAIDNGFRDFKRSFTVALIITGFNLALMLPFAIIAYFLPLAYVNSPNTVMFGVSPRLMYFFVTIVLPSTGIATYFLLTWLLVRTQFTYHIMIDNPELSARQCVKKSFELTDGRVGWLIRYNLSFILWEIGAIFTLGLLALYVQPYMSASNAGLYLKLISNQENQKI